MTEKDYREIERLMLKAVKHQEYGIAGCLKSAKREIKERLDYHWTNEILTKARKD